MASRQITTIIVVAVERMYMPLPHASPMADVTQRPAAVVSPLITCFWNIIVPAPMKPIPVTTCEAIREGSSETFDRVCKTLSNPYCDMIMKSALPEATRRWVRSPASLALYSRSRPIMPPKIAAINMRMIISVVILLYLFFAKIV